MKTVIYHGREYESVIALCRELGISLTAYYNRKKAGVPLTERIRAPAEWLRKPVTAGGVEYESIEDFCAARGISRAAYYQALKDGRPLESIKPLRQIGVDYGGVHYDSLTQAALAHGVSVNKLKKMIGESQKRTECTK